MDTEIKDIVAPGTRIVGTIEGKEPMLILGEVEGKVVVESLVVVGQPAKVKAEIHAKAVTVEGQFEGSIVASELVAVIAGSRLKGSVKTPRLIVEDNAVFDGEIQMGVSK